MPGDRFSLEVDGLAQELRIVRFAGREAISELFQFDIVVASEDPAIAPADVIGKVALLRLTTGYSEARLVHGIVARFQQGDAGKTLALFELSLVPRVWTLLHRSDCRIFQDLTTPEIVAKVLDGAGITKEEYRQSLRRTYPKREYCVQYRESDWSFIARLLEDEGISHHFEHHEDKHVLVFADAPAGYAPIAGEASLPFHAPSGALAQGEYVDRVRYGEDLRTGTVTLRDWSFKRPSADSTQEATQASFADLAAYDHPGGYERLADGEARALVRLEERQAQRKLLLGGSGSPRFLPGATFTLTEHAREPLNREWLLTRVEHRGAEPLLGESAEGVLEGYENQFEAIPADVPFRPPLLTPRPTIKGVQSAIVVGPAGEEIHVDEHGRVKVQFHWDRLGKRDAQSSCWLRVGQPFAGEAWGAMFLPRIGHEVMVQFFDGDPDRPIVCGSVYHGTNVPPYALPANKTVTTIKSRSTPGGEGFNELRFEDKKGSEEIYLHGQKDWTIAIENDKTQTIGHDEKRTVTHDRTLEVGADQKEKIGANEVFEVVKNRTKTIGNDETESIGHDRVIQVTNDHTESIGGNATISIAKGKTEEVAENASESIGKTKSLSAGKDYAIDVAANLVTKVGSKLQTDVELEHQLVVGNKITITCGDAKVTVAKNGDIEVQGANLAIKASGDVKVESGGKVEVKASGDVKVEASGKVEVKGSGPVDVSASGAVKVKGTTVGIN